MVAPEPVEDLPPIAKTSRNTVINLRKLHKMNGRIQALLEPAEMADKAAKTARTSAAAKSAQKALKEMANKASLYVENARELYGAVKEKHAEIMAEKQVHDEEVEAQRKAELEEKQRQEEEARLEREKQALAELAKTEIEQSKVDKEEVRELFSLHDFDTVVSTLEDKASGYQTEDGKAALQVHIDRFKLVADMRQELIAAINTNPQPWGWGSGTSARDLAGASEKGISVVGSSATYPWKAVGAGQMLKFIDYYLKLPKVRIVSKMKISIGAAIYCDEFGEKGKAKAKTYLNRALDLGFSRREQERLIDIGW